MINAGDFSINQIVRLPFNISDPTGATTTISSLTVGVFKDSSSTARASANGITSAQSQYSGFSGGTVYIDLSDNTTSGFWAPGHDYFVTIGGTVSSKSVSVVIGTFSIENRSASSLIATTGVATAGGSTSITLQSTAVATTDYYTHCLIIIVAGTGVGQAPQPITAYNTSRVATVAGWAVNPDSTSEYKVLGFVK